MLSHRAELNAFLTSRVTTAQYFLVPRNHLLPATAFRAVEGKLKNRIAISSLTILNCPLISTNSQKNLITSIFTYFSTRKPMGDDQMDDFQWDIDEYDEEDDSDAEDNFSFERTQSFVKLHDILNYENYNSPIDLPITANEVVRRKARRVRTTAKSNFGRRWLARDTSGSDDVYGSTVERGVTRSVALRPNKDLGLFEAFELLCCFVFKIYYVSKHCSWRFLKNSTRKSIDSLETWSSSFFSSQKVLFEKKLTPRRLLRVAIKTSKRRCWRQLCDEVNNDVWGKPYRIAMSRLGCPQAKQPSSPLLVRGAVAALFPRVPSGPALRLPRRAEEPIPAVTLEELKGAQSRIKERSAPGPDGIPNSALKIAIAARPDIFLRVYTMCLETGVFPSGWKRQRLVLLPKPGKPPDEPSSYRPLCMLDTAGKILERIICDRLEAFTERPGGLSERQYGFGKGDQR
ncbi:unnamed protein product [Trichogramma brassicae]|uniref:Reverse transcriptase domain-containing protein n=1 Tax=Trichogramma brassicae TaxID=86971 RepID=A0A6H5IY87_9HYME|nr:unnamed protein product [Trichogramma brassicae]